MKTRKYALPKYPYTSELVAHRYVRRGGQEDAKHATKNGRQPARPDEI